ncbi:cytochrome c3 family protein [Geoglobus acetivorans]|uniref:Cytochrome C family protein n=1 Tax=Geoglobus acetivorans TaxID=565033 RepID=A0A0A7GE92_GEOAI|nr:cytochrome C family protein [Geoglobus acetivorans]
MKHVFRALFVFLNILIIFLGVIVALRSMGEEFYPGMADRLLGVEGIYGISGEAKELTKKPVFADAGYCENCHQDVFATINRNYHGFDCQTCHGPPDGHPGSEMVVNKSSGFCLMCHRDVIGRYDAVVSTVGDDHGDGRQCVECHNPHEPYQCSTCHSDVYDRIVAGKHTTDCKACHGEVGDHPKSPAPVIEKPDRLCRKCHTLNMPAGHEPDWKCTTCHEPHNPMGSG